jgi:SpoVK/Ycf46/Vps4 family AAA+-type ATPase
MRSQRKNYLTFYEKPDSAPLLERIRVRLACRLMFAIEGRWDDDLMEAFLVIARPLVFWSRGVLKALAEKPLPSRLQDLLLEHDDGSIRGSDLLESDTVHSGVLARLQQNKRLRSRWIRETLEWIDLAGHSEPPALVRNVGFLADSLRLGRAEQALTMFIAIARNDEPLLTLMRRFRFHTLDAAARKLYAPLDLSFEETRLALQPHGILVRLGIANLECFGDLEDIVRSSNGRIYRRLQEEFADARDFLSSFLKPAASAQIGLDDISHVRAQFDIAKQLVRQALERGERGVHVLLYGDAGAGKTEFAHLLARELKAELFEADYEDDERNSANAQERLSALLLAVRALANRRDAFVLFDEAEDVFPWDFQRLYAPGSGGKTPYTKAWMNRLLENLALPVVWVTNNIEAIDPAYVRRFLLHVRFPELPSAAKQRLTERYLGSLGVGSGLKKEIARLAGLTPAQLESASRFTRLCEPGTAGVAEEMVRLQIRSAREAVGLEYRQMERIAPIQYSSEYVNLAEPMTVPVLVEGLRMHRRAAVCFHGEPGTGKTELAHHVARELGRELVYKSVSDLVSPWVGVTEQKIAAMFASAEARCDDVVVLLDEADTFLRDRRLAHASWEASQTNEFLARMECFPGIFICTTNLADAIDPAALRRFLFRVEFLPMRPEQRITMFEATFGRAPVEHEIQALRQMSGLVPADFANVARQLRFMNETARALPLELLKEECRARRGSAAGRRPMGFLA